MFHLWGAWDSVRKSPVLSPAPGLVAVDVLRELGEVRRLVLQNPTHLRVALAAVAPEATDVSYHLEVSNMARLEIPVNDKYINDTKWY